MEELVLHAARRALVQVVVWIGPLFVLAWLMQKTAGFFERTVCRLLGVRGYMLLFGWLGASIHELSHALVALIFKHRVTGVRLFTLSPEAGKAGSVRHTYDRHSVYQRAGNFFIGVAPVFIGSAVIYAAAMLLVPQILQAGGIKSAMPENFHALQAAWTTLFKGFRNYSQWDDWRVYLFFYLAFCIGSAMRLSRADLKGAWYGALLFLMLLFAINFLDIYLFSRPVLSGGISRFLAFSGNILLLALIINLIMAIPVYVLFRRF